MTTRSNIAPPFTSRARRLVSGDGLIYFVRQDGGIGYADILAAARACGREHDVLVLDFPTRTACQFSPIKSNTFNPFAYADVEDVRRLLVGQVEATQLFGCDGYSVFKARAIYLMETLSPVLVWLRDTQRVTLDAEMVSHCLQYSTLANPAFGGTFTHSVQGTRLVEDLGDVAKTLLGPIRSYFLEIGGYDPSSSPDSQRSQEPTKQHCYVTMYLAALSCMARDFADILHSKTPEVDMDDVLTNARVLVVRLPSLEASRGSHEGIMSLVLTSLQLAMSARTATCPRPSETSDRATLYPDTSVRPVSVVLSEADTRSVSNLNMMAAQGRSVGVRFCSGLSDTADNSPGLRGLLSVLSSLKPARLLWPRGTPVKPPATVAARLETPSRPSSETAA